MYEKAELVVEGKKLAVSNLNKVLYPKAGFTKGQVIDYYIRDLLSKMKLKSWAKTSGSKGLQVYVPLNTPVSYEDTKALSRSLAQYLERDHPDLVTSNMSKAMRKAKVFVDWSQNDEHKTTIC